MANKPRKTKGQWGEPIDEPQPILHQSRNKPKLETPNFSMIKTAQYPLAEIKKEQEAARIKQEQIDAINRKADARVQIQRITENEKALKKRMVAQAKINKAGGAEYVRAKSGHLRIKRRKQIKQWNQEAAFDRRPEFIQNITKRKKGKRGTSKVGNVIHSLLYPVQPRGHKRW